MQLLDFVGIYGTILAPVGAIIIVDHFWAKKLGIQTDPAEKSRLAINWIVLIAWLVPVAAGMAAYWKLGLFPSYLPLPCAIACGIIYVILMKLWMPAREQVGAV